jgi:hypothetical protein
MVMKNIRIRYGSVRRSLKVSPEYQSSRRDHFPNCDDIILGGSILRKVRTRRKAICSDCCNARNDWLQENHAAWLRTHEPDAL